jgi:undecaprenyl diphosphate synthase
VKVIGSRDRLPADILSLIAEAERLTADNSKLTLVVAFNYGSRDEIVRAVRAIAAEVEFGGIALSSIDEAALASRLDTAAFPDLDLLIRTSGEYRLSNFLLWQAAYAELVFLPVLWPDFDGAAFDAALDEYASRSRRFGGVAAGSAV